MHIHSMYVPTEESCVTAKTLKLPESTDCTSVWSTENEAMLPIYSPEERRSLNRGTSLSTAPEACRRTIISPLNLFRGDIDLSTCITEPRILPHR